MLTLCLLDLTQANGQALSQNLLEITVTAPDGLAVAGANCVLSQNGKSVLTAVTDETGKAHFEKLTAGSYVLKIEKEGFENFQKDDFAILGESSLELSVKLNISNVSAEVTIAAASDSSNTVEAGASPPAADVQRRTIERLPLASKRVDEAIPLVPGVIRSTTGEISINGASEQQSAFRVNGLNVADPASGNFRLNLPVDAVESVQVFLHPYSAEFGQFTGGLTNIETRRGGDKLHFEINDFLPDFRFRNGKIYGVQDDSPHININGPLIKDKLFFSQSLSYNISKQPVRGLDPPNNETISEGQSSFSQIDWVLSAKHSQTFTFGYFPEREKFVGLDFFRQRPVTPNYKQTDFVFTLRDNYSIGQGLLQSSVSLKKFKALVWAQGNDEQTLTPAGEFGNYFSNQERRSFRVEVFEIYDLPALKILSILNNLKTGFDFSDVGNRMNYLARPVNVRRADGTLAERDVFDLASTIRVSNRTYTGFIQDRLILRPNISLDLGFRLENQNIASERNFAPRGGFAWSPLKGDKTIVRGGIGFFYDKVPLNIRAFRQYPARTVTRFAGDGRTIVDERRYPNILVDNPGLFPLDFRSVKSEVGFVPENVTWNLQLDQIVNSRFSLRANYTFSRTTRIYIVNPENDFFGRSAIVLSPTGGATYAAFELTAKFNLPKKQPFYVSYVRSRALGDLNDFNSYFGNFGAPLIRQNQSSNSPTSVPNRLLAWGQISLPHKIAVSPILEVRSGFPYSIVDQEQNFVGTRNASNQRFPVFYSLDAEISKDFQITKKYGLRLSARGFNLTNHFNPRDVRNNLGDRQFGSFINSYRRYFTGGFDIIF